MTTRHLSREIQALLEAVRESESPKAPGPRPEGLGRQIGFLHVEVRSRDEEQEILRWEVALAGESESRIFADAAELRAFFEDGPPLRLYHASATGAGDREVIALLDSGMRDFVFSIVRGGTVISSSILEGKVHLRNAKSLFGGLKAADFAGIARGMGSVGSDDPTRAAFVGMTILALRMIEMTGINPLDGSRVTISGLAAGLLQSHAGAMPIDLDSRESHRGARCEALEMWDGQEVADRYDVNSNYAKAFLDVPARDDLLHVRVKVKGCYIPPFFDASQAKMIFPTGILDSWIFRSNYDRYVAPHLDGDAKILTLHSTRRIDFAWMRRCQPAIEELYAIRRRAKEEEDVPGDLLTKALLVSCYGRLAPNGEVEGAKIAKRAPRIGHYYLLGNGEYLVFYKFLKRDRLKSNFAFGAYVTDNGRTRGFAALRAAERPIYFDNDALWLRRGEKPLDIGTGIGQWKFEARGHFEVNTVKDYVHGDLRKRKGGESGEIWTIKQWAKTREKVVTYERHRRTDYDKRRVLPGGATAPWKVKIV